MVWYGTVWYGMVWYVIVWYGMVWCVMVWYGVVVAMSGCRKRFITLQPRPHHHHHGERILTSEKGLNTAPRTISCARRYFAEEDTSQGVRLRPGG